MVDVRKLFGTKGEWLGAEYLKEKGYEILKHQYKTPYGEIDLVCLDGQEVVFVEVKTRHSDSHGHPEESVTPKKLKHIINVGEYYLEAERKVDVHWRIDVLAINAKVDPPEIVHIEDVDIPEKLW